MEMAGAISMSLRPILIRRMSSHSFRFVVVEEVSGKIRVEVENTSNAAQLSIV